MVSLAPPSLVDAVAACIGSIPEGLGAALSSVTGSTELEAQRLADFVVKAFVSVFVILDPPGLLPVFLSLTDEEKAPGRRRTAFKASTVAFCTLAAFIFGGPYLLAFFGITVPAFRIAGGILFFIIALGMLRVETPRTRSVPEEVVESRSREDISVFPLGIPMLAGPGTIATVIVLAEGDTFGARRLLLFGTVFAVVLLNLVILLGAGPLERLMGRTGMNIVKRIMGLILAVMAVQFVIDGIREVLPGLLAGLEK